MWTTFHIFRLFMEYDPYFAFWIGIRLALHSHLNDSLGVHTIYTRSIENLRSRIAHEPVQFPASNTLLLD